MRIRVKLYASLRKYLNQAKLGEAVTIEVEDNATVTDVVSQLGIVDENLVKIIFVNGIHALSETILHENDLLVMFPPVGGGRSHSFFDKNI